MKQYLHNFKSQQLLKLLLIAHILILLSVYVIEYGMNVYACKLCKYQRIPYFINIAALSLLILDFNKFKKIIYILLLSLFINLGISFYHIGVEQKIFSETKVCKITNQAKSKDDLLKQLNKSGIKGCSKVTFRIFGFSLSTLNFITNIVFLLLCYHITRNEKK